MVSSREKNFDWTYILFKENTVNQIFGLIRLDNAFLVKLHELIRMSFVYRPLLRNMPIYGRISKFNSEMAHFDAKIS